MMEEQTFEDLIFTDEKTLAAERHLFLSKGNVILQGKIGELIESAAKALKRGPFSVMDKRLVPPSGNKHDYFHCAPYLWPVISSEGNVTAYLRKDGQRHPAAEMYSSESNDYDRSSLQRVFDDTTLTALAWYFTGNMTFANHGAKLLDAFFIANSTRMNPHMKFAQYSGKESKSGIIEMKDLYYFLDAVRLLEKSGALNGEQIFQFRRWLLDYSKWLQFSRLGLEEMLAPNNHGIYFDLQIASIAAFLKDRRMIAEALARSISRIPYHFTPDGVQVHEMIRPTSKHYCTFNLMAWINFGIFSSKFGSPIHHHQSAHGASINQAVKLLLKQRTNWPYPDIGQYDEERFGVVSLMVSTKDFLKHRKYSRDQIYGSKSLFHPHDGVKPFWNLGLKPLELERPRKGSNA